MSRKIVAIGGGQKSYETREIDSEIVKLTEKEQPNFLFLAHSQIEQTNEESYFCVMKEIYEKQFRCKCKTILKEELKTNFIKCKELMDWADIVYEGGGDTKGMIEIWQETGFDKLLRDAWQKGKVMCGVSAGANAWFKTCSSDSLKIQLKDDTAPMINVERLNFVNAFFTPHCDVANEHTNRLEHMKQSLKGKDLIGLGISNCCAIEIIDDKYRLITADATNYGIEPYGIKTFWDNDKYIEKYIDKTKEFKQLNDLFRKK